MSRKILVGKLVGQALFIVSYELLYELLYELCVSSNNISGILSLRPSK